MKKKKNFIFCVAVTSGVQYLGSINEEAAEYRSCFEVYVNEHDLTYEVGRGMEKQSISLSQCQIMFMLDNLVRQTFKADPVPGECRSKQKCLLPSALQGLPKDS